jgi:hypothetical protein
MPANTGNEEISSVSSRTSTDIDPQAMQRDDAAESTAFLSNHNSNGARASNSKHAELIEDQEGMELEDLEGGPSGRTQTKESSWRRFSKRASRLYKDNLGLLLIAAAQAFFACMNLFVQLLTASNDPVPALEVSFSVRSLLECV